MVISKSFKKTVTYALTFWNHTTLYIERDDWNIDNNTGKRSMNLLVVGRKIIIGFGSHRGASLGACVFAVVETCRLNKISEYEYIKKVLTLVGDEKEDINDISLCFRMFWQLNCNRLIKEYQIRKLENRFIMWVYRILDAYSTY